MSDKKPWECYPNIWKNSSAFFTYLRGTLRRAWVKNPIKLEYIRSKRKRIENPNTKGHSKNVWGFACESCGREYPLKDGQVDHITPAGKLNNLEDIQGFVERLLCITDDDLQLVCKKCHAIITHSQRTGLSFEEAELKKKVIMFSKLPARQQRDVLKSIGYEDVSLLKTKKAIVDVYEKLLNDEVGK